MAKRPRFSRWRRLPGVYRFYEEKAPDPNLEPQRLTLYLTGTQLDNAESLAAQEGGVTLQEYCTRLLQQAIEGERIRAHVANIEAQRGVFEGLHEIADDPEYLAEWSAQFAAQARDRPPEAPPLESPADPVGPPQVAIASIPEPESDPDPDLDLEPVASAMLEPGPSSGTGAGALQGPTARANAPLRVLGEAAEVVLRQAGPTGDDAPSFLGNLRRGESVPMAQVAELARALHLLEIELRDATAMDRRLAYGLHRLAFEAQVLHTDAWPGAFDAWTVDTVRAVQEAVDRILSGQDIRYSSPESRPEIPL